MSMTSEISLALNNIENLLKPKLGPLSEADRAKLDKILTDLFRNAQSYDARIDAD